MSGGVLRAITDVVTFVKNSLKLLLVICFGDKNLEKLSKIFEENNGIKQKHMSEGVSIAVTRIKLFY